MSKKAVIILAAAVVLLFGGIAAVALGAFGGPSDADPLQTEGEPDGLVLYSVGNGTVSAVEITASDGERFSLVLSGGVWSCPEKPFVELDKEKLSNLLSVFSSVNAERVVTENADDLSEFGFDEPSCTVSVTDAADRRVTFVAGMKNQVLGSYYFMLQGESKVYLVSSDIVERLSPSLSELAAYSALPMFDYSEVTDLCIKNSGGMLDFALWSEPNEKSYTDAYKWFTSDGETALSEDAVRALVSDIMEIYIDSVADASPEDISIYGFDGDEVYINVNYTSGSDAGCLSLRLGDMTEDGSMCYAMTDGSESVFLIEADLVDFADVIRLEDFVSRDVCLIKLGEVESVSIYCGGAAFKLEVEREYVTQGGSGEPVLVGTSYTVDGKKIAKEKVEAFFTALNELSCDGYADSREGERVAELTFMRNTDRFTEMTLSLYSYDTSFCRASLDGNDGMLVNRKAVESLIAAIGALAE